MVQEELAVPVVEVLLDPQADLVQMTLTVHPPCRLPSRLNGREQEGDQSADDGDDHQELDQRETEMPTHTESPINSPVSGITFLKIVLPS